jgi:hypothetical protein
MKTQTHQPKQHIDREIGAPTKNAQYPELSDQLVVRLFVTDLVEKEVKECDPPILLRTHGSSRARGAPYYMRATTTIIQYET